MRAERCPGGHPPLAGNQLVVNATNISSATIDPKRAKVDCGADVQITTDTPIDIVLAGCRRTVHGR